MTLTPTEVDLPAATDMAAAPSASPVSAAALPGVVMPAATEARESDAPAKPAEAPQGTEPKGHGRLVAVQPVLEKLFELYPQLFGAEFLPLKLGIFQELLARHPDQFQRDTLKAALGVHTRSGRYLQSVAARHKRHDLDGAAVEDVAPEHVYLSIIELFRRRQARSREDLRPKLRAQLLAAFLASGLTSQAYLAKIPSGDAEMTAMLQDALAAHDQKLAKQEALQKAFAASGKTPGEFADMYGLPLREVTQALAGAAVKQAPLPA